MQSLLSNMHEDLKSNGYTNRKLAKRFDVSHTTVNSYFKATSEFDFMHFVESLRLHKPNNINYRRECVKKMFEQLTPVNERVAMEVLNMYGEYGLQKQLTAKIINSDKTTKNARINKKIASIYDLLALRLSGRISNDDFFAETDKMRNSFKTSNNEAKILSGFAFIYAQLNFGDYRMVSQYTNQLKPMIDNVSKDTIRKSYSLRIKEMESMSAQRGNDLETARKLCFEIINDETNPYDCMKSLAYCTLAETHMMDYEKAHYFLEQSFTTLPIITNKKLLNRKGFIKNTLDFLNIVHEKNLDKINPSSLAEKAHLYAKIGKEKEAVIILEGLEKKYGSLTPFQKYYKGLATGDKTFFEEAIADFEKTGDFFYISLPKMALK
ncbi:AimR family lysis-lysogeny pheromone receptor [Bacillus thuringiensis]|uniref:AimR family lysis-lysogeny pheromone receptor n=1 Tax=Bacillus thuringiensis TaxID=1428 RepID=UPI002AB4F4A2|nr:AimR family lysis-lysogeny pheromone receptor [Bacillus thuringiensis]MDY8166203.1 AimR family lysis-lysogeny pheromone receptor [Bacillus thuringiensis]